MAALFFPNLDALRLALTSGLVPAAVARAPARAGFDTHGHLWLEADGLPVREALTALGRFGVIVLGSPGVRTQPVRCWAELLPVRRVERPLGGPVLFDLPDQQLAALVARLRRGAETPVGVRLLPEPHEGRAWVTAYALPTAVLLWADTPDSDITCYREQAPGVWVAREWEHPLVEHLTVPAGAVLLLAPGRDAECVVGPVPQPQLEELPLRARRTSPRGAVPHLKVTVRFRLARSDAPRDETLWVLSRPEHEAFDRFCRTADERLLRRFLVATLHAGADARVLIRRADPADRAAVLPISAPGFQPDPRIPSLFVPTGRALRPRIRVHELTRELVPDATRLVWVEPDATHGIAVHSVAASAFRPLREQVEYAAPQRSVLATEPLPETTFALDRFALLVETSIEIDPEPEPMVAPSVADEAPEEPAESEPGWMSKSVGRMFRWMRRRRDRTECEPGDPDGLETTPSGARRIPTAPDPESNDRVERKLSSPDALLHGHDWASRRHELESRLLADLPRLGPESRASRWAELAGVYGVTGQALDAALCWTNALWDSPAPPNAWFEQWVVAECRAAKRNNRSADLDRWLGEPARPGTGRVVAALAARFGFQSSAPLEFVAALPRVLAVLEQHADDIPVRAAWLARLAVARSCDGDVLGLARWRDRLLRRLHDRGPALDLDEPSFLRFRGPATAERFKTAREWLVRIHEPVMKWVKGHAGKSGLQAVGLDAETKATAEYAQLLLAWGLGVLGERARSRDWAARARKALAHTGGPRADPAGHAFLGDLFLHRIKEAHEGHAPKPGLPHELQDRLERLPEFARYSVDRLREHCRILEPVNPVRAYRGRDLREFLGQDQLGERLAVLGTRTDLAELNEEARALLTVATGGPSTATVPRIVLALLEVAPLLEPAVLAPLLDLVPTALDWTEAWVGAGRWREVERAGRVARFQGRLIVAAFAVAPAPAAQHLLRYLARGAAAGPLLSAIGSTAPHVFRAAHKFKLTADAEALVLVLDPTRAEQKGPVTAERVGLAVGWFVAGDEEAGNRILDAARENLFLGATAGTPERTALALAYAEALGFAPARIALGRLEEVFQRLDHVTVHSSSNCYYTLHPLRLIDAVVRAVVTDEFAIPPAVSAWLDEDEFLIRRRIHRDMAALLRESETV
jgi:cellulose synthase operon protein C